MGPGLSETFGRVWPWGRRERFCLPGQSRFLQMYAKRLEIAGDRYLFAGGSPALGLTLNCFTQWIDLAPTSVPGPFLFGGRATFPGGAPSFPSRKEPLA